MNANLQKLMVEMQQARSLWEEGDPATPAPAPAAAAAATPRPVGRNIGQDYNTLRDKVKETVTELERLMTIYERNLQQLYSILGQKGLAIGSTIKTQAGSIERMQKEIETLTTQAGTLKTEHEKVVRQLEERIQELEGSVTKISGERDQAIKDRDAARRERDQLQQDKDTVTGQVADKDTALAEAKKQLQASIQRIEQLGDELEAKKRDYDAEVLSHGQTKTRLSTATGDLDKERLAHGQTRTALATKKGDYDNLSALHDEMKEQFSAYVQALEEENAGLKETLASLEQHTDTGNRDSISPIEPFRQLRPEHRQQWGQFNLKEHLERAVRRQDKKSWF